MFSAANMATLAAWLLHPATATLETSSKLLDTRYWHPSSFVAVVRGCSTHFLN